MVFPLFSALAVWQGAQADVQMPVELVSVQVLECVLAVVQIINKPPSFPRRADSAYDL